MTRYLLAATGAGGQMGLDHGRFVGVECVKGEDTQQVLDLRGVRGRQSFHDGIPASASAFLMRCRPLRIRLLTVPSGVPSSLATSR